MSEQVEPYCVVREQQSFYVESLPTGRFRVAFASHDTAMRVATELNRLVMHHIWPVPETTPESAPTATRADLELFIRMSTIETECAAPLYVTDEKGPEPRGWVIYFHDERTLFVPDDGTRLPLISDETRTELLCALAQPTFAPPAKGDGAK